MKPKRYPKLEGCRIRLARAFAYVRSVGKFERTVEQTAMIYGVCARSVRREIDWFKKVLNKSTMSCLVACLFANGLGFANDEEKQHYLEQEKKLREVA